MLSPGDIRGFSFSCAPLSVLADAETSHPCGRGLVSRKLRPGHTHPERAGIANPEHIGLAASARLPTRRRLSPPVRMDSIERYRTIATAYCHKFTCEAGCVRERERLAEGAQRCGQQARRGRQWEFCTWRKVAERAGFWFLWFLCEQ